MLCMCISVYRLLLLRVSDVASRDTNHAALKRHKFSIRNTRLMRGIMLVIEHLPYLLVSHACSFLLGAVT